MSGHALFLIACSSKISPFSSIYVIFLRGILKKQFVVYLSQHNLSTIALELFH